MSHHERINRRELWIVAGVATVVSICAFVFYFNRGQVLLYGDAVAHINIARRVFDSRTPGPLQLGTVWLPVPHIAMIPFIVNHWMWQSGLGGSIPSMIAYVLGTVGIYRALLFAAGRRAAVLGTVIYALNPNLLYMQSTAMTESVFLATVIWSIVYLDQFVSALGKYGDALWQDFPPDRSLEKCAIALSLAILTRYDGWILAAVVGLIVLARWRTWNTCHPEHELQKKVNRSFARFMLLCALVPILWFAHNYALSARPLDFYNGPYSAKAIEQKTTRPGGPPHPGTGSYKTSAVFFMKAAKENVSAGPLQNVLIAVAVLGTLFALRWMREFYPLLLLWLPLLFYAHSVAYGSVPIFLPMWWPHSYYNVRYGLELLPAIAIFAALSVEMAWQYSRQKIVRVLTVLAVCGILTASYVAVWRSTPICLREAIVNSRTRVALEKRLAAVLRTLPKNSTILMETGSYVGALQEAGIPLRRVVWEGAHPEWDEAMADPAGKADYVVAVQGDSVWYASRLFPQGLSVLDQFDPPEKPTVTVYKSSGRK